MNDSSFPSSASEAARPISDQAQAGIEHAAGTAHEAVQRVANAAESAAARVQAMGSDWVSVTQDWTQSARGYARDHPVAAIGLALSAGYLLSRVLSR
jgi:ElaB/YqjD/DUF883 family membrane-anchored ribosome-binding protein